MPQTPQTAPWETPAEGQPPWGDDHPQQQAPVKGVPVGEIRAFQPGLMDEAATFARTHGPGTGKTWAQVGSDAETYGKMLAAGAMLPGAAELDPIAPLMGRALRTGWRALGSFDVTRPLELLTKTPEIWKGTSAEGEALRAARTAEKGLMPGEKAAYAEDVKRAATKAEGGGTGGTSVPKARLVLTPEEVKAQEQMQRIATQRASERGMQYAGGMKPAPGKISMGPGAASSAEFAGRETGGYVPAKGEGESEMEQLLRRPLMHARPDVAPVNMIPGAERATSVIPREELMSAGKYGSTEAGRAFESKLRTIQNAHPDWSFNQQLAEAQK